MCKKSMDRNYLSVRLTIWHLEAGRHWRNSSNHYRERWAFNLHIEGAAVQRHLPPLCDKRCGQQISNFYIIPGNESDTP